MPVSGTTGTRRNMCGLASNTPTVLYKRSQTNKKSWKPTAYELECLISPDPPSPLSYHVHSRFGVRSPQLFWLQRGLRVCLSSWWHYLIGLKRSCAVTFHAFRLLRCGHFPWMTAIFPYYSVPTPSRTTPRSTSSPRMDLSPTCSEGVW